MPGIVTDMNSSVHLRTRIRRNLHRAGNIMQKVRTREFMRNTDSRGVLGSTGRSFLTPNHVFDGFCQGAQKRETGSIRSEGDLRGWIWVLG